MPAFALLKMLWVHWHVDKYVNIPTDERLRGVEMWYIYLTPPPLATSPPQSTDDIGTPKTTGGRVHGLCASLLQEVTDNRFMFPVVLAVFESK